MQARILMSAYACNPEGTGEYRLGWGWAREASREFEVHLVTTPIHRAEIERHASRHGIRAHYVDVPRWYRRITGPGGQLGTWLRQVLWQVRAARLGERLHRERGFALVHHTTFHTFRVPFLLDRLGIPSVWGPIAGGECVPAGFDRYLGRARHSERLRHLLNRPWLEAPVIQRSLRRADVVFVSNHTTLAFLPAWCHARCRVVPANALPDDVEARPPVVRVRDHDGTFRLLFVGNCFATRVMPLVFEALREADLGDYLFTVVGGGAALGFWKREAARLGVADHVRFTGRLPRHELDAHYSGADVFVFPALRDSGGSGLLEAMLSGVPVVCFDWGGPAEMVDERSGVRIAVDDPAGTVRELADWLRRLRDDEALRRSLASAAVDLRPPSAHGKRQSLHPPTQRQSRAAPNAAGFPIA
jgi:glycosyltransferase involved in cell wall biosynthesis